MNSSGAENPERVTESLLRQIPAVDELLSRDSLRALENRVGRRLVVDATRKVLQGLRSRISSGALADVSVKMLEKEIVAATESAAEFSLRPVINGTGVILHTNLGRAPIAREAAEHVATIARGYSNLEYDLDAGERGKRDIHTDALFARLLGAEMSLVVNNNAAAVFLALNSLAADGEVIVSRGELIEIGGSFRIPDICAKSGAALREVGTTNRTRISDYANAIGDRTRALVRIHPSNFRVVGFTERPSLKELVELAAEHQLPLIEDLGSGCLVNVAPLGIHDEPWARESIKAGVDVVTFSGDKLLGGPQAGILTGKKTYLEKIRKNPLFRALRVDKLTIAALEATVSLYIRDDLDTIPIFKMIRMSADEIGARATRLAEKFEKASVAAEILDGASVIGGGSTPGQSLATRVIALRWNGHSAQELDAALRRNSPPIIARVEDDQVLIDLRTVFEEQEEDIVKAFARLA